MHHWHAVGVFCEDIREETRNLISLMGIMPDNINVPKIPGRFPRLGVYARVHVNADATDIGEIKLRLRFPDGSEDSMEGFTRDVIRAEQTKAKATGKPFAGFGIQMMTTGLPIKSEGLLQLIVSVGSEETVAAMLYVKTTSTSSEQPASQSQSAS